MASQPNRPMFDLLSYARRGLGRRDSLSPAEILQVAHTVGRTPEVMVKILPRGANDLTAVRKHLDYIGRKGNVELESDDGEKRATDDLLDDWDLDLDEARPRSELSAANGRQPPRLIHKVLFSMPAGTPPAKVLTAAQNFCREEFGLKHRYAMALHTDEPHPHVHVVVKAISEQGVRLNIRNAMRRQWRSDFAQHLRALGVPANGTDRFVRGATTPRKSDGIYRAALRGESTHMRARAESVAQELATRAMRIELGKAKLVETRADVHRAWQTVGDILVRQRQPELAKQVMQFMHQMPSPMTEREQIAAQLVRLERELQIGGRRPPVR
jgi:type IV secretory pathway VirD2 relaxase